MKTKHDHRLKSMPDCNDAGVRASVVTGHSISQTQHDDMVKAFFGTANVAAKNLPLNDNSIDYTKDCTIYGIKLVFDPANKTDNNEITSSMALLSSLSAPHTNHFNMYSLHLFRGLKDLTTPVTKLELRKGYRKEDTVNVPTVVIAGIAADNTAVFWGDLTSMIPFTAFFQ